MGLAAQPALRRGQGSGVRCRWDVARFGVADRASLLAARARTPALQPAGRPALRRVLGALCALDNERRDAVDDGVSAGAGAANQARIFSVQIPVAGWAGELGHD